MGQTTFSCFDGHTCGNPVRLVASGGPRLEGATMSARRQHFLNEFDWVRRGLMFEPRGHDMMSGGILYPPTRDDCDVGVLFIETSGCLPMCGHGTIGLVTMALENGLVAPRVPGMLDLDTPAGKVSVRYESDGRFVDTVTLTNVPAFVAVRGLSVEVEGFGVLTADIAYGGNFYAILDAQECMRDLSDFSAGDLVLWSPRIRAAFNAAFDMVHPGDPTINGISHVLWTGQPKAAGANARNAVFYGDKAIDRSPCGTGTSARMAQWFADGKLGVGDPFVHESIIGSLFTGTVVQETEVAGLSAIVPSVQGWARQTGVNTITIDPDRDPYAHGFSVV